MRLQSKAAVVTGAATGIGQAIATAFAQEGACSAVDSVGKPATADETMRRITADGGCSIAIAADVSNLSQVQTSIDKTVSHLGRIDIVVNNAGMEFKKPFLDYPLELWQKILAVNLTGQWFCAQAGARQMVKQGDGGRIITHEDLPMPTNAACAAKGGLRMLVRTIAVELAPHKLTVNNGPGAIYTPIDKDVEADPAIERQLMSEIPLRHWSRPEEVAELAVYLASEAAAYATGSTYFIDGGMLRNAGSL